MRGGESSSTVAVTVVSVSVEESCIEAVVSVQTVWSSLFALGM